MRDSFRLFKVVFVGILFFSTTIYKVLIEHSIKAKFETLISLATIKIFAYREELKKDDPEPSMYFLFRKPRNRLLDI